jgi:hypothetical protein
MVIFVTFALADTLDLELPFGFIGFFGFSV